MMMMMMMFYSGWDNAAKTSWFTVGNIYIYIVLTSFSYLGADNERSCSKIQPASNVHGLLVLWLFHLRWTRLGKSVGVTEFMMESLSLKWSFSGHFSAPQMAKLHCPRNFTNHPASCSRKCWPSLETPEKSVRNIPLNHGKMGSHCWMGALEIQLSKSSVMCRWMRLEVSLKSNAFQQWFTIVFLFPPFLVAIALSFIFSVFQYSSPCVF